MTVDYTPIKLPIIKDIEEYYLTQHINNNSNLNDVEKSMVQTIMTSALHYTFEQQKAGNFNDDFKFHNQLNINEQLSIGLVKELRKIVGVQPLHGPVDLVKLFQYEKGKNGYLSLACRDVPVEASSKFYAACIKRNETLSIEDKSCSLINGMQTETISNVLNDLLILGKKDDIQYKITKEMFETDKPYPSYIFELNKASNRVATKSRRGFGNRMIVPPKMLDGLCKCSEFTDRICYSKFDSHELTYIGKYRKEVDVYVSPLLTDKIIVGYVGNTSYVIKDPDVGYVYSPYVPAFYGGVVINRDNWNPEDVFMTRYSRFVRGKSDNVMGESSDYYSVIDVEFPEENIISPTIVTATPRKLTATWTLETKEDLEKMWEGPECLNKEKFSKLAKEIEDTFNEIKRVTNQQPFWYSGNWLTDDMLDGINKVEAQSSGVTTVEIDYTELFKDNQPMTAPTGQIFIMKPKYTLDMGDGTSPNHFSDSPSQGKPEDSTPKKKNILKRLFD